MGRGVERKSRPRLRIAGPEHTMAQMRMTGLAETWTLQKKVGGGDKRSGSVLSGTE